MKMKQQQMHSWYSAWQQKQSSGITRSSSSSSRMTPRSSVRKQSGSGWALPVTRLNRRHKPQQQLHSTAAGG
jgi:hypothetical protein